MIRLLKKMMHCFGADCAIVQALLKVGVKIFLKGNLRMFSTDKSLSKVAYIVGILVIFLTVYVQYFVDFGPIFGYLVVYGVPIVVVILFFGKQLLSRAAKNNKLAFKYGLGLFGALTLLGVFLIIVAFSIILQFDPNALNLLNRPNPVLNVSSNAAWVLIAVSMLVVGPAEEYLFRGFMFGGLLSVSKGKYWIPLAILSSLMFAFVHGYYAITYGVASVLAFIDLATFGVAMCITYYWSKGNILAPAIIHGLYDATGFLGVATIAAVGTISRFVLIGIGVAFAVAYLPKKIRVTPVPNPNPDAIE
jgi:membrane protease YdiL (CAAX protease family)